MRDLAEASVYESYALPKMYYKVYYSVSAAIHLRYVSMMYCLIVDRQLSVFHSHILFCFRWSGARRALETFENEKRSALRPKS